jgi:hypothetical protein
MMHKTKIRNEWVRHFLEISRRYKTFYIENDVVYDIADLKLEPPLPLTIGARLNRKHHIDLFGVFHWITVWYPF